MFTHARCGGVLVPIVKPEWWPVNQAGHGYPGALLVRCRRCGREGEAVEVPK